MRAIVLFLVVALPQAAAARGTRAAGLALGRALRQAITERTFPGAAVAAGRAGGAALSRGYGHLDYRGARRVTPRTRFDLASLTKVVGTTCAAMRLYEEGRLDLDAPLARYLPAYAAGGKGAVTIRQLLSHSGGLGPSGDFHERGLTTRAALLAALRRERLVYRPGAKSEYSDLGMILVGLVLEAIAGESLPSLLEREVFRPLGMARTGFRPTGRRAFDPSIAPTELDRAFRGRLIQGEVHDETAWILGGAAGHAGLFSTAEDLGRFASMLAAGGVAPDGRRFLRPETIALFTRGVIGDRALGWQTRSPEGSSAGRRFGPRSFGHTGFTGTSLWIDPDAGAWVVLLANAVHPARGNPAIRELRPRVADLAFAAVSAKAPTTAPRPRP